MHLRSPITVAGAVFAIAAASAALAQSQSFDGNYKGSLKCEHDSGHTEPLRTPLAMGVHNGRVTASIPLFDLSGRTELSALIATGTVQVGGGFRLVVTVYTAPDDLLFVVDFRGTLSADGGTLAGLQLFSLPAAGKASRTCEGSFTKIDTRNR